MFKKILASLGGLIAVFAFAGISFASTSVRLEQPKSPTNQDTFTVTFVALDSDNSPVTVKCYKKGPNDGAFAQFGSDITLSNGGNTDNCSVDSSIVNTGGTYSFYVIANGVQSNTVTVDFNRNSPGTPSSYNKTQLNSCQYQITFRTADDNGETYKVELYRSTNTSFSADSGSKVQSQNLGSSTNGSFTDTVPDCNATYYYAIRAFDSAGNGSGVVGDSQTITTIINPTGTPGSANNSSTTQSGGAIPVVTSGVTPGEQPTGEAGSPTPENKQVLGAKVTPRDTAMSSLEKYGVWGAIALGILIAIFILLKRMKKSS